MKKTSLLLFASVFSAIFLFSCNKEEHALNFIHGKWAVMETMQGNHGAAYGHNPSMFFVFQECDKGQTCPLTFSQKNGFGETVQEIGSSYKIDARAQTIQMLDSVWYIESLDNMRAVLKNKESAFMYYLRK